MVHIVVMGSRRIRHRTGCCGSRTQEETIIGFFPHLYRSFGQHRLKLRYVDIDDPEATQDFPHVVEAVRKNEISLPVAIHDNKVVLHGQSTLFRLPDYIRGVLKAEDEKATSWKAIRRNVAWRKNR